MFALIRHGDAQLHVNDRERMLSESGKSQLEALFQQHKNVFSRFTRVLSSPYVRTLATAQILTPHLMKDQLIQDVRLQPDATVSEALKAIEMNWADDLLVVTHQPLIGRLINYLEEGSENLKGVAPGELHCYSLPWPGPGCALAIRPEAV